MPPTALSKESLEELLRFVVCPGCQGALQALPDVLSAVSLRCTGCGNEYPIVDGIPILLVDRALPGSAAKE